MEPRGHHERAFEPPAEPVTDKMPGSDVPAFFPFSLQNRAKTFKVIHRDDTICLEVERHGWPF